MRSLSYADGAMDVCPCIDQEFRLLTNFLHYLSEQYCEIGKMTSHLNLTLSSRAQITPSYLSLCLDALVGWSYQVADSDQEQLLDFEEPPSFVSII